MTARQLLSIFRRHRWLIGAIVAGVTLITAVAVFTATPIFEATATVRVELVGGSGDEETANAAQNEARMETEARLYASRAMAAAVIKDLDLVRNPAFTPLKNFLPVANFRRARGLAPGVPRRGPIFQGR